MVVDEDADVDRLSPSFPVLCVTLLKGRFGHCGTWQRVTF